MLHHRGGHGSSSVRLSGSKTSSSGSAHLDKMAWPRSTSPMTLSLPLIALRSAFANLLLAASISRVVARRGVQLWQVVFQRGKGHGPDCGQACWPVGLHIMPAPPEIHLSNAMRGNDARHGGFTSSPRRDSSPRGSSQRRGVLRSAGLFAAGLAAAVDGLKVFVGLRVGHQRGQLLSISVERLGGHRAYHVKLDHSSRCTCLRP